MSVPKVAPGDDGQAVVGEVAEMMAARLAVLVPMKIVQDARSPSASSGRRTAYSCQTRSRSSRHACYL
jgi:hypothetical protein